MKPRPIAERLWASVDRTDSCWNWTGPTINGYGVIGSGGRGGSTLRTHRVAYEILVGQIPDGLHIDHLCRNRACCNPKHLEPVTQAENNRRAGLGHDKCLHGHDLPPRNAGDRRRKQCRVCRSAYDRSRYQNMKASAA